MKKILLTILLFTASTLIYSQGMDLNHKKIHIVDSTMGLGISPTSRLHVFGNGTASNLFNVTNDKDATKDSSVVVDAIGNVGIGKTPNVDIKLDVDGFVNVDSSLTVDQNIYLSGLLSKIVFNRGGNISAPGFNCKFTGLGIDIDTAQYFAIHYNRVLSSDNDTTISLGNFHLNLNNYTGKVGIGTTTPNYKLDVFGNGGTDNLLKVSNDINSTYDSTFVVNKVGKVGIGTTTPLYNLDIGDGGTSDANPKVIRINSSNKGGSCPLLCFSKSDTIRGIIGIYPASISSNENDFTIESDWESNIVLTTSRSEKHLEIDQNGSLIAYKEIMFRDSLSDFQKGTTLSDNEAYALPTGYSWKGEIDVDSLGYTLFTAQIRCDANGTPYLEGVSWKRWSSKTYVEVGSTDGYLNITDGGSGMVITNTLGYTIKATLRFRTKQ